MLNVELVLSFWKKKKDSLIVTTTFYIKFCDIWRKYLHSATPSSPPLCFTLPTDGIWVAFENLPLCPKPRWWPPFDLSRGESSTVSLLLTGPARLLSLTPRPPLTFLKLQTRTELYTKSHSALPILLSNGSLSSRSQYFCQHRSNFNSMSQNQMVKLLFPKFANHLVTMEKTICSTVDPEPWMLIIPCKKLNAVKFKWNSRQLQTVSESTCSTEIKSLTTLI